MKDGGGTLRKSKESEKVGLIEDDWKISRRVDELISVKIFIIGRRISKINIEKRRYFENSRNFDNTLRFLKLESSKKDRFILAKLK